MTRDGSTPLISPEDASRRYRHGTRARARLGPCSCFPCRVANTTYETERQARMRKPWRTHYAPPNRTWVVRHRESGEIDLRTTERAEAFGRRDELNAEYEPEWDGQLISTASVRRHLKLLSAGGIGRRTVHQRSGVSENVLSRIRAGEIRRTRRSTAERILAVGLSDAAGAQIVDAAHTWELIECLRSAGWPKARIARALGAQRPALQLKRDRVLGRNARAVEQLHERAFLEDPQVRITCEHARCCRRR